MKKIFKNSGVPFNIEEARALSAKLQHEGVKGVVEHRSVCGYSTPQLAEKANKNAILDTYKDYTTLFIGTEYCTFEGYKVVFIGVKELPEYFFEKYSNYSLGIYY